MPTRKELAEMARAYDQEFHTILALQETEKAVAIKVIVDFCDLERDTERLVWIPKSQIQNGCAPGWLLSKKMEEIYSEAEAKKLGSVYARWA